MTRNVVLNAILDEFDIFIKNATEKLNKIDSKEIEQIAYWNGYINAFRDAKSDMTLLLWDEEE